MLRGGTLFKTLFLFGFSLLLLCDLISLSWAGGKPVPLYHQDDGVPDSQYSRAKIDFYVEGGPIFHYAGVSASDPVFQCPLETFSPNLKSAVDSLVVEVQKSVNEIKAVKGDKCAALKDRLAEVRTQVGDAIRYRLLFGVNGTAQDQDVINQKVQQASALSGMILTATSMVESNCISSINDQAVIQRLLGQVVTLGGLYIGGWEGVALAGTGMLISNLPIFRSSVDRALEILSAYEEKNKSGSFLCLYRQMQRTSCLLFAHDKSNIINGFDLTLNTGMPKKTEDSLAEVSKSKKGKRLIRDINLLRTFAKQGGTVLSVGKTESLRDPGIDTFNELKKWCRFSGVKESRLSSKLVHPKRVLGSIEELRQICSDLGLFEWDAYTQDPPSFSEFLRRSFLNVSKLVDYYSAIKQDVSSEIGKVLATLESRQYFQELAQTMNEYRVMADGNQERLNYFSLTEEIGETLARKSLKTLMKENHKILTVSRIFEKYPRRDHFVRKRALLAMLNLCKTFDPTLACLYVDRADDSRFFQTWKDQCVGTKSKLCKSVLARSERDILLTEEEDRAYFNSLCGIVPWVKTQDQTVSDDE